MGNSLDEMLAWMAREVDPAANAWEENQLMPAEILRDLARYGLTAACVPKEYGGLALDSLALGRLSARLGRGSCSLLSIFVVHAMVVQAVSRFGDATQKSALLPRLAKGELRAAFALTEPDIGSDATAVACVARRTPTGFVLEGRKKWISASRYADIFMVLVRLSGEAGEDEGLAVLLVPATTPGLCITPLQGLLGFRAAGIAELHFENCQLPAVLALADATPSALLGTPGSGFSFVGSHALDTGRFIIGWGGVGILEGCLEASVAYAKERIQFGQPLEKHQLIRELIADIATDFAAAQALSEKAATERDAAGPNAVMSVTQAKYFSSRASVRAASAALQIHGGNGCAPDFPLQRYFRDAKILEIIEGSSQMQQLMIAGAALMRGRRKKHGKTH
ncbi:acyl-CoA dehydrogenase [Betaproteobacteria bacterium]|nr:acyl-CoA dehydrogenase [Betaproteobacteria bacterium]